METNLMKKILTVLSAFLLLITLSCTKPDDNVTEKKDKKPPVITESYNTVIMVYLDGDNNLEAFGLDDINEMEAVNLQDAGIKIIVLIDRISGYSTAFGDWANTRLYEINYDSNGYDSTIISKR